MTESETERERIPYGEPQTWYFTFGFGTAFAQRYYKVENETFDAARDQMFQIFGREWAFQYDEVDWYRDGVSQAEQWSHRWVVSGHWRNQWYPASGIHRQIWISPFVKGPESLPLVVKPRRAFVLNR